MRFVYLETKQIKPGLYLVIGFYEKKDFFDKCYYRDGGLEDWDYYVWTNFLKEEVFNE